MGIFGDGYRYHVTGLIHDVRGFPTERPDEIVPFMNRLFRKINQHFHDIQMVREEQTEDAEVLVVAYGSVARSARRAVVEARERGVKAGLLQLITLWPFPRRHLEPLLRQVRAVLVPELEHGPDVPGGQTGQPGDDQDRDPEPDRREFDYAGGDSGAVGEDVGCVTHHQIGSGTCLRPVIHRLEAGATKASFHGIRWIYGGRGGPPHLNKKRRLKPAAART